MHTVIRMMCACYSVLLVLYERRLRDVYGAEMVNVLREQMIETCHTSGITAPLRVGGRAFWELATLAVPSRLNTEQFAVFSFAACASFGMLFALCRIVLNPDILDPWMRIVGLQC